MMSGYTYAVARVRALENGLLSPGRWERLAAAATPEEAWRVLSETVYSRWMENRSPYQYEEVIWDELRETAGLLRKLVEEEGAAAESFLLAYLLKYDMHNLKSRFLAKAGGRPGKPAPVSRYGGDQAARIMADPKWVELTGGQAGGDPLARATLTFEEKEFPDPQELQLAVDLFYYGYMAKRSGNSPRPARVWALLVDLINLRILLRVKTMGKDRAFLARFLLPGGLVPERISPALAWSAGRSGTGGSGGRPGNSPPGSRTFPSFGGWKKRPINF